MIYNYTCLKCKKKKEIDIPMGQNLPDNVACECGGLLKHDFAGQVKTQAIDIPHSFRATSIYAPRIKYKKDAITESLG